MELMKLVNDVTAQGEHTPTEVLLDYGDKIDAAGKLLREVKAEWERRMVARIERDGPIKCGDILYRVGNPPTTKCLDVPKALEALLHAVNGDFEAVCAHLSANALKHGACSKTLPPDVYATLFHTEREKELQADEATPRRLAKLNLGYVR